MKLDWFSNTKYLICLLASLGMFSCSQNSKVTEKQVTRETLNLNFNSNILTTSPETAQTDAEKFVRELMFETLCNADSTSSLFNRIDISEDQKTYSFVIDTTRRFNNDLKVNTETLKAFFKEMLNNYNNRSAVEFFSNVSGYSTGAIDLPDGITFINSSTFSIELKKPYNVIECFAKEPFYLSIDNVGTGTYINTLADDDILFVLERVNKVSRGVNYIHIRFIKNQKEMLSEFLNGNIDILESRFMITDSANQTHMVIDELTNDKYDGFNVSYLKSGYINYYSIYEMYDSLTRIKFIEELAIDSLYEFDYSFDSASYFDAYKANLPNSSRNTYRTQDVSYEYFIPKIINQDPNRQDLIALGIQSVLRDKYFYKNDISQLSDYKTLTEQIINVRFKHIEQF